MPKKQQYKVRIANQAEDQIEYLLFYYDQFSKDFTDQIIRELSSHVKRLSRFPKLGRIIDKDETLRIFSLNSIQIYVLYKIYESKNQIVILSVLRQEQMIGFE